MLNAPEIVGIAAAGTAAAGAGTLYAVAVRRRRRASSTKARAALLAERLYDVSDQARRAVAGDSEAEDDLIGAVEAYLQASGALQDALVSDLDREGEDDGARERLVWAAAADLHVVEDLSLVEASQQAATNSVWQWLDELAQDDLLPSQAIEHMRSEDLRGALLEAARAGREQVLPQLHLGLMGQAPIAGGADTPTPAPRDLARICQQVSDQIIDGAVNTVTRLFGNTLFGAAATYGAQLLPDAIKFATTGDVQPVQGRVAQLIVRCVTAAQSKLHTSVNQVAPVDTVLNWLGRHWRPLTALQGTIGSRIFRRDQLLAGCHELIQAIPEGAIGVRASSLETVGARHKKRNNVASFCGRGLRFGAHGAALHPPLLIAVAGTGLLVGGLTIYIAQDYLDWPPLRFLPDLAVGVRRTLGATEGDSSANEGGESSDRAEPGSDP